MATGGIDRIVRLINVPSRTFLITKANGFLKGHNSPVTYVGIQANENRLISTSQVECIVQVQRIFSKNFKLTVNTLIFWVMTCMKIIIFNFQDNVIRIWDISEQTCLLTLNPKTHQIRGDFRKDLKTLKLVIVAEKFHNVSTFYS